MSTTPRVSIEESKQRDRLLPNNVTLSIRLPKWMRVNIVQSALLEKSSESAVIRRWIRNGAALEGHDTAMW